MEVEVKLQREYDPNHPNYLRWQKARDISKDRADFVKSIISNEIILKGLRILDIGSGEGSTSKLFSENNFVVSLEPKRERISKISNLDSLQPINADGLNIPFKYESFDLIILQDVIEHLEISDQFVKKLYNLLSENGIIYLSTPNRFSLFNIISDPHWGLPLLTLFKREQIRKYFIKVFRKSDYNRDDIAELVSLGKIKRMFNKNFAIKLCTKFSVKYLLNHGKGIIWSKFHIRLVNIVKLLKLDKMLLSISNDKPGILNSLFTPTFYLILKKQNHL